MSDDATPDRVRDQTLCEDLSRLNNQLANLQREPVRKNVELARLNEQKNQWLGMAAHDPTSARGRLPIVALSANVQRDEMQRCLAVGIEARIAPAAEASAPVLDLSVLQGLVGDDPRVIADGLQAFRDSAERARAGMRHGVASGSIQQMALAAHSLRPGARAIGALALASACVRVESAALAGRLVTLDVLASEFEAQLDSVLRSEGGVAFPSIDALTKRV